ncbi:beta-ketoacyl synthase N-terminal-like domain-containing protein [Nocardiopsis chromatogenes]|uniref:beta-ketoacyl synthase N-terminal-like domain-containing protein n=1 Tax=Nocardiopsis chromatogenes TaxID=280239 RepID=UPI0003457778|nr:beta-ketoacyl synthase N-terminal-like domain-containing protein [Nocardiopsis chromatogenes]
MNPTASGSPVRDLEDGPDAPAARPAQRPVDIVACGAVSPVGLGLQPLAAPGGPGSASGNGAADGAGAVEYPPVRVHPADYDPAEVLGRKGLGKLTRTDRLAMSACALALEDAGRAAPADRTGIVLGASVGSAETVLGFLHDTFTQERPYLVSPSDFPGTLMNSAAGRAAIRNRLTGLNATVSGGPLASLHALRYARTALLNGRADRLLAGAAEELSPQAAWMRHGELAPGAALGEGAAVFALEAPGAPHTEAAGAGEPLGRLLACSIGFADPAQGPDAPARRLAACVEDALARVGAEPTDVALLAPGGTARAAQAPVERKALGAVFGGRLPQQLDVAERLGDTNAAGAALALASVLARWREEGPDPASGGLALLTAVGPDGSVGCLLAARPGPDGPRPDTARTPG